jgi:hypothetical protein
MSFFTNISLLCKNAHSLVALAINHEDDELVVNLKDPNPKIK